MIQVIQQTRDEKISLYMRTRKAKLAEMLANCNEIIEAMRSLPEMKCPKDCQNRSGRACVMPVECHCIRRAKDYYKKR